VGLARIPEALYLYVTLSGAKGLKSLFSYHSTDRFFNILHPFLRKFIISVVAATA
jgi:hypothetical protein